LAAKAQRLNVRSLTQTVSRRIASIKGLGPCRLQASALVKPRVFSRHPITATGGGMVTQAPLANPHRQERIVMTNMQLSIEALKAQAKRLRAELAAQGIDMTHSQTLETIAHQHGSKDWNTLFAKIGNRPACPVWLGQVVTGKFMGQPFIGEVIGVRNLPGDLFHVVLDFDEAVDVVTFDSFSNFRKRVQNVITSQGRTDARTSNGQPHLVLDI
jgi:hypothetical protein